MVKTSEWDTSSITSLGSFTPLAEQAATPIIDTPEPVSLRQFVFTQPLNTFSTPSSFRRVLEYFLTFICTIVLLRSMFVEPFGVPTGSMAPTLTGNHRRINCPDCNYSIRIGEPTQGPYPKFTFCPNCDCREVQCDAALEVQGDRLLVDKQVFQLRSPRRWEVAVFRCPVDHTKPYVKRVVGLPGENILLDHGDVWIDGMLCRKDLAAAQECAIPIWEMTSQGSVNTWQERWRTEAADAGRILGKSMKNPYVQMNSEEITLDGTDHSILPLKLFYVHLGHDLKKPGLHEQAILDTFGYNQFQGLPCPTRDFGISFDVRCEAGQGQTMLELNDSVDQIQVWLPSGQRGKAVLKLGSKALAESSELDFFGTNTHHVELLAFDRRVHLMVDGKLIIGPVDLPDAISVAPISRPCTLGALSSKIAISKVKLVRDIYYRSEEQRYRNGVLTPCRLGSEEYFVLGDNSSNSEDSRSWQIPAVPERSFLGKPFLLHQPSRPTLVDVQGEPRLFQTLDWERIRLIR
jgi:signal peptidase I